jgi:hypothetical protein
LACFAVVAACMEMYSKKAHVRSRGSHRDEIIGMREKATASCSSASNAFSTIAISRINVCTSPSEKPSRGLLHSSWHKRVDRLINKPKPLTFPLSTMLCSDSSLCWFLLRCFTYPVAFLATVHVTVDDSQPTLTSRCVVNCLMSSHGVAHLILER